jgi:hypothetical protein
MSESLVKLLKKHPRLMAQYREFVVRVVLSDKTIVRKAAQP